MKVPTKQEVGTRLVAIAHDCHRIVQQVDRIKAAIAANPNPSQHSIAVLKMSKDKLLDYAFQAKMLRSLENDVPEKVLHEKQARDPPPCERDPNRVHDTCSSVCWNAPQNPFPRFKQNDIGSRQSPPKY